MGDVRISIEIIRNARLGRKESINKLTEIVRPPLRSYIYRRTLDEHLTDDILQESMLEMFKILPNLRKNSRFWPWLCKISINKIRLYHRSEKRRKAALISKAGRQIPKNNKKNDSEVAGLVAKELRQNILNAMRKIKLRHREILALRCYEDKNYAQIAKEMKCTELGARLLFYRAKKSLARELARNGLGKGSLLLAMTIMGKLTAPSKAAAAGITVTSANMSVGPTAAMLGAATTAKGISTIAACIAITAGSVTIAPQINPSNEKTSNIRQNTADTLKAPIHQSSTVEECCYFFPEGPKGPFMIRSLRHDTQSDSSRCRWLQNEHANYRSEDHKVFIENHRFYCENLAVHQLPADSPQMTRFIYKIQHKPFSPQYAPFRENARNLMVVVKRNPEQDNKILETVRHYNVSKEEFFLYDWPRGAKLIDRRDKMHKRGWTYFRIKGNLLGKKISAKGRIPFVYEKIESDYPWLEVQLGSDISIVDSPTGARLQTPDERSTSYPSGAFFAGLPRPWTGLHTIDIIRRDAAEQRLKFDTRFDPKKNLAYINVTDRENNLLYTVNMVKDLVEKITLNIKANTSESSAEYTLEFNYLQDVEKAEQAFRPPPAKRRIKSRNATAGMLWLLKVAQGSMPQ